MKKYKKAYVEVTNICNFRCSFCVDSSREKKAMTAAEFAVIAPQIKRECDYCYLHVLGEPLGNPNINEIIKIANENGLMVNLTTNGSLINRLKSDAVLRKISVSLNGVVENVENLDEYFSNLFDYINNTTAIVELRLFSGADNAEILARIEKRFNLKTKNGEKQKLSEKVYLEFYSVFTWPGKGGEKTRCWGLVDQFAVLVNGDVVPCCVDFDGEMKLGNLFSENLSDILSGEMAKSIEAGFKHGKAVGSLCKRCNFERNKVF